MTDFEENVRSTIHAYKNAYFNDPAKYSILIKYQDEVVGKLRPVPSVLKGDAANDAVLQTDWRNLHKDSFFAPPFTATVERTIKWLKDSYFYNDTTIIFMVETVDGEPIGHFGFSDFAFTNRMCECGRLLRGTWGKIEKEKSINIMQLGQKHLLKWAFDTFILDKIYGRAFADNWLALKFDYGCGFYPVEYCFVEKHDGRHKVVRMEITKKTLKD